MAALGHEDSDHIFVACGSDEKYVMPLVVTLSSLASRLPDSTNLTIFILSLEISEPTKARIRKALSRPNQSTELVFLDVERSWLASLPAFGQFTSAIYLRIFLAKLLPDVIDKVLYLDSDLLVRADILPLWRSEIGDHLILAAQDIHVPTVSSEGGIIGWSEYGMDASAKYFNSGVLLLNLKKWRDLDLGTMLLDYIVAKKDSLLYPDQDALNKVCYGQWGVLNIKWNITPLQLTDFAHWPPSPLRDYVAERYDELWTRPAICHFTAAKKPWIAGYRVPYQKEWFEALRESGWFSAAEYTIWYRFWTVRHYYSGLIRKLIGKR